MCRQPNVNKGREIKEAPVTCGLVDSDVCRWFTKVIRVVWHYKKLSEIYKIPFLKQKIFIIFMNNKNYVIETVDCSSGLPPCA